MKNQSTNQSSNESENKQSDTSKNKKETSTSVNNFLQLIAAPGLIQHTEPTPKKKEEQLGKEQLGVQAASPKKTIRKKKASVKSKHQIKTATKENLVPSEKQLMTVRVDTDLFQLAKFLFASKSTKSHTISYKIINDIIRYWIKEEHPEYLALIQKKD